MDCRYCQKSDAHPVCNRCREEQEAPFRQDAAELEQEWLSKLGTATAAGLRNMTPLERSRLTGR